MEPVQEQLAQASYDAFLGSLREQAGEQDGGPTQMDYPAGQQLAGPSRRANFRAALAGVHYAIGIMNRRRVELIDKDVYTPELLTTAEKQELHWRQQVLAEILQDLFPAPSALRDQLAEIRQYLAGA